MAEALAQAAQALTLSNPNPRVGCVLTTAHGQVLGRGFTQEQGRYALSALQEREL